MTKFLLVLFLWIAVVFATHGIDISQSATLSTLQCLHNNGYDFAIVRAGCSTGRVDTAAPFSVKNAWAAKFAHVDVYIFPCPKCGNPANQIRQMVDYLHNNGANYGMIWLDIEGPEYWTNAGANREFFNGLVAELKALGKNFGVYTNHYEWSSIMGDWNGGSAHPLWYAHWDGQSSFSDFRPFAGWTHPAMKQIQGDTRVCGFDIDRDWY